MNVGFLAVHLGHAIVKAAEHIGRAAAEAAAGVVDTGVHPRIDYEAFDEALAKMHLANGEEMHLAGELRLEYEPQPVEQF